MENKEGGVSLLENNLDGGVIEVHNGSNLVLVYEFLDGFSGEFSFEVVSSFVELFE